MFIDMPAFDFVERLEKAWREVRADCLALPPGSFEPWVQREMYGDGWDVYGLIAFGERIEPALSSCPRTALLLAEVPGLTTAGFSRMAPGSHIKAHVGWVCTVYRLHLGLVVPPDCALRVGSETRSWREGDCLILDDTIEHEAWNRSQQSRTVLLLDFLRPGMTEASAELPPDEVQRLIRRRAGKS